MTEQDVEAEASKTDAWTTLTWRDGIKKAYKSYSSIHTIRGVLRPAFQMAMDDDYIRKNPFQFQMVDVLVNDSVRRDAIHTVQIWLSRE